MPSTTPCSTGHFFTKNGSHCIFISSILICHNTPWRPDIGRMTFDLAQDFVVQVKEKGHILSIFTRTPCMQGDMLSMMLDFLPITDPLTHECNPSMCTTSSQNGVCLAVLIARPISAVVCELLKMYVSQLFHLWSFILYIKRVNSVNFVFDDCYCMYRMLIHA